MKCSLIEYTQNAAELLIFTKNTRHLTHLAEFKDVFNLSDKEKANELEKVFSTISGPLEFVYFTFLIQDVSRGFTHQLVRTRHASYAQQSQRVADMSDFRYFLPDKIEPEGYQLTVYEAAMNDASEKYGQLINHGVDKQDARNVLPTATCTNVLMKINLRSLSQLLETRLCVRAQGEYQQVAIEMRLLVAEVMPWALPAIKGPICVSKGICMFPRYDGCPIKKANPWLVPGEAAMQKVHDDWARIMVHGFSPQPVV